MGNKADEPIHESLGIKYSKRAIWHLNIAYTLFDAADTFLVDGLGAMQKLNGALRFADKHQQKMCMKYIEDARKCARRISEPFYEQKELDDALSFSDFIAEAVRIIVDKTGDGDRDKERMLERMRALPQVGAKLVDYSDVYTSTQNVWKEHAKNTNT